MLSHALLLLIIFFVCLMDQCFKDLFRSIFTKFSDAKMLPEGESINAAVNKYQTQLKDCTKILLLFDQGYNIHSDEVTIIITLPHIKQISSRFPTEFSFRKLSTSYLLSKANSIIATCSVLYSLANKFNQNTRNLKDISDVISESIHYYVDLAHSSSKSNIFEFKSFEIDDDISNYLDFEKINNENHNISQKIEDTMFKSHVCCLCNEEPAISYVTPCNHAFLCLKCLTEAVASNNIWKCYVCGKKIDEVKKVSPSV